MTPAQWKERVAGTGLAERDAAFPVVEELLAEVERLTQHSSWLNTIAFRIAKAIGDVPEGADKVEGNPIDLAQRLVDAFDRERLRTEMMAYQRGAVLEAVHRMQLGNWTKQDIGERVDEIFRAGMAAEVKQGFDETLTAVSQDREALSNDLRTTNIRLDVARDALYRIHDRPDIPASLRTITEHALRNERWEAPLWVCAICSWTSSESQPCPDHGHTGAHWCCDACQTTAAVLDAEIVEEYVPLDDPTRQPGGGHG